jgi:transposase
MLTGMTEDDWTNVLMVFRACQSRRGDKGRDDRLFLEAMHFFAVENVSWRRLPRSFGKWNSVWKRFSRLSDSGVFEAFFESLAGLSPNAHLVQMFDSTVVRAQVSAAGAKGGKTARRLADCEAASRPRSISRAT